MISGAALRAERGRVMSLVSVSPEGVAQAAGSLGSLGSVLDEANAAAALSTMAVQAPGVDEISVAITNILGIHAQQYQAAGAQAAEFHSQFINLLNSSAGAYAATEAANVQRALTDVAGAPGQTLPGRPLLEAGATGAAAASVSVAPADAEFNFPHVITVFTTALYDAVKAVVQILGSAVQQIIASSVAYLQEIVAYIQALI